MIIAVMEMAPRLDKRQAMLEILRFIGERVRIKPECLACDVFEAVDESQRVVYVEQWQSTKALHAHIKSRLYFRLFDAMELAVGQPKVNFHEVSQTSSMELIQQLRGSARGSVV